MSRRPPGPAGAGDVAVPQAGELRSARIESLRALAALAVVFSHIYGDVHHYGAAVYSSWAHRALLGGGFAVYVFFGLTGYLLYLPFARRIVDPARRLDYRRYAANRAVRILPLYYVVVVVYLILLAPSAGGATWLRFLLFGENFSRATVAKVDGPVWSLVVELHFYLLLPFLAWAVAKLARGSLPRAAAALGVLGAVAVAVRWHTVNQAATVDPLWQYNLPATFFFFVPGMLLALLKLSWEQGPPSWLTGPLRSSLAWLAASAVLWLAVFDHYDWDPLVGLASFVLIGACVLPLRPSSGVRALDWRPLAILGTASYSLYLWHLPIVDHLSRHQLRGQPSRVQLALLLPLTIVVALASYRVVEAPFLRLRRRWQGDAAARSG